MERKPNVFPTQQQRDTRESEEAKIAAFEAEKAQATHDIYVTAAAPQDTPQGHYDAVEAMRLRTEQQLATIRQQGIVVESSLAEKQARFKQDNSDEQMRLRDEQLRINEENIQRYQHQANQASARGNQNPETNSGLYNPNPMPNMNQNTQGTPNDNYVPPTPPTVPPVATPSNFGQNPSNINPYIAEISQPNYNGPFDVIPLPSQGKLYPSKKANIRVGFMTTADENILSSPNLLASGEFLEILINRKVLEPELRYKDLNVGDRNAIMLWLRATGYGEMYPVTIYDENDVPFETDVNLMDLKTKNLGAEPDVEGLFELQLPLSKANIKFKLLTCGDVDDIEKAVSKDKEDNLPVDSSSTYTLERTIVEVNGDRNRAVVRDFANSIRIGDGKFLMDYIEKIESGVDLNINVKTPGGGSVATFLPLNIRFFWPNVKL